MRTSQKIGTYILSVLALTGFHSLFAQTNNCDISWLSPVQVSHDSVSSIVPQLSVQGDTIHVLWLNTDDLGITSNDGILYSHSYDGGQSFSPQQKLLSFDSTISSGVFIASQENSVYATFIAIADTFYGTAFTRSTDAGTTWEPVRFLFRTSRPRFIVTQGARVYIHFLNQRNNRYGMLRSDDNGITWQVADSTMPVLSDMVAGQTQLSGVGTIGALTSREVEYY